MITFEVDDLKKMNSALQNFLNFLAGEDVCEDDLFDSRLVSCELITNVVRHCGEIARFSGDKNGNRIVIKVSSKNTSGCVIKPTLPDVFAESGRGLYIVNTICHGDVKIVGNEIRAVIRINYVDKK
jgi:anti-sigma regulatory factor (Ser/Thr protein kinase)